MGYDIYQGDAYMLLKVAEGWRWLLPANAQSPDIDWLSEQGYIEMKKNQWDTKKASSWMITPAGEKALKEAKAQDLFFNYSERYETISEPNPDDQWDNGQHDAGASFDSATWTPIGMLHYPIRTVCQPGEIVDLVWMKYSSGDTFGSTGGQFDAVGIARTDLGRKILEQVATKMHDDYFGGHESTHIETTAL